MGRSSLALVGFALIVTPLAGCGGSYESKAKGVVTLNGAALSYGWVAFHPKSGGPAAYAPIDSSGSYVMRTGNEEGLKSGDYLVTVTANEPAAQLHSKDGGPMPTGKSITPAWYGMKDRSGLVASVKPGRNEFNFELNNTPPPGWKPSDGK